MMGTPLFVVATGARTPLGLHSAATAAAVRAAISSCSEHPFMVDLLGDPMAASMDAVLDARLNCNERMLAMAQTALQEATLPFANTPAPPTIPLWLGLPEPRPGFSEQDAQQICQRLIRETELPVKIGDRCAFMAGHSAVLSLLDQVMDDMNQGKYNACIVGGVDSYFHPDTLQWLDQNRQLAGDRSRSGFVPGEGAGFCLLANLKGMQHFNNSTPVAIISSTATAWESKLIKTQDINLGEGLTHTIRATVQGSAPSAPPINAVYCDINGERYRGEEWGFTCLKLAQYFDDPTGYCSPADCWGDMGAASGALFMVLATQAAQRGYAQGTRNLLWASSEQGLRAAALVETNITPTPFRG